MKLNSTALGLRIKAARKQTHLSQMALAEILDCSPTYLSYVETGNRGMNLETFVRLSNALGSTADALLVDSLENTRGAFDCAFAALTADCSQCEKRIMLEVAAAAKQALRKHAL